MAQRPRRYEPTWHTCRENSPSRLPRRRPRLSRRHRERKPCRRRPQFRLAWSRNSQATYVSQRGLRARHHHRIHYMHHVPMGLIYRFKFLMLFTLLCAATTVIFFIISQVNEGHWKWGGGSTRWRSTARS
ncbi:uncharacterized protein LOC144902877 isoform X2 [Branchiostoma floridae x Branchiostoma belcheri]